MIDRRRAGCSGNSRRKRFKAGAKLRILDPAQAFA
jgi:hypothetical protein